MEKQTYRMEYFVRSGKFEGLAGESYPAEVQNLFRNTIDAFRAEAEKERENSSTRNYIGSLEITIKEN